MKPKKLLLLSLICCFTFSKTKAQNYYINFTASGTTTTLDSVYVENLTQGTSLTLQSSDTLHLLGTACVNSYNDNVTELKVYPNPFNETSQLEFYSETSTIAELNVYDILCKHIHQSRQEIQKGTNIFEISGFAIGHYKLSISTDTWQKSAGFVSLNTENQNPQIQLKSTLLNEMQVKSTSKSTKNVTQMSYTTGDQMRFTGYSGALSVIVNDVPTSSKTIDFVFTAFTCGGTITDTRDGNVYTTVQIGTQCWMEKNLAYLPSVFGPDTGSQTTPYYYVSGYSGTSVAAAKTTSNYTTYGVLYNWPAAMAGSAGSMANPSGVQGICPAGWHLPSITEWRQLSDYLGGTAIAGGKLKETGTTHWYYPNTGATNETGFTALPGGDRNSNGMFNAFGATSEWWSTTYSFPKGLNVRITYYSSIFDEGSGEKYVGDSVRCVMDL